MCGFFEVCLLVYMLLSWIVWVECLLLIVEGKFDCCVLLVVLVVEVVV